jgi:hypothetical protein
MKKTIFTAMMLIGMMGSAQTIETPIVVNGDSLVLDIWTSPDYDTNTKRFSTENRDEALNVAMDIMYKTYGRTKWPETEDSNFNGTATTEWILPNDSFMQFVRNEKDGLYFVVIYE